MTASLCLLYVTILLDITDKGIFAEEILMKTEWYRLHDFQLGRFPSWPVQYVHNLLPVSTC